MGQNSIFEMDVFAERVDMLKRVRKGIILSIAHLHFDHDRLHNCRKLRKHYQCQIP